MPQRKKTLGVERRGIEFVPLDARYGTPRRLFTVWFSVNLTILCLTVGTLGVNAGLSLGLALAALALGNAIGTVFMAAHSAQGPHLGIPQMIQSRAQFGVIGAGVPLLAVVTSQTLYASANGILIQDTIRTLLSVSGTTAIVLFSLATVVIAFFGYELIHRVAVLLAVLSGALVVGIIVVLASGPHHAVLTESRGEHQAGALFLMVVAQGTAWSLSSGPTVADYSRYLPERVSIAETFWYTGLGNFLGSFLMMAIGACLAAWHPDLTGHSGTGIAALFGRGSLVAATLITLNLLFVNVMILYSGYMSAVTIATGVRGMKRVPLPAKFLVMAALMLIATAIALLTQNSFDRYFSDLLSLLVYVLIPWSAINLADYYVVRKGIYSIDQMFQVDGLYGSIRWKTLAVYAISIATEIPFMKLSFFTGAIARMTGADMAWLPGLVVAAALYCAVERPSTYSARRAALDRGASD